MNILFLEIHPFKVLHLKIRCLKKTSKVSDKTEVVLVKGNLVLEPIGFPTSTNPWITWGPVTVS